MKFTAKQIVATAIGAALFFVLARFVSIPIFANTYISLQYAVLGFFAAIFGPLSGLLIGLIGHALSDLTSYGAWWSWIITSALVGLAFGFVLKGVRIEEGEFEKRGALQFIIGCVVIHAVGWIVIAPVLDILIYGEPANKVFAQGLIAAIANIITTAVIGTILLYGYSKTRTKSNSLTKV